MPHRFHAATWAVWAVAAAVAIQIAPNPLYAIVVVAIAGLVVAAHGQESRFGTTFRVLVLFAFVLVGVRVILSALTVHGIGAEVLDLPEATLPRLLGGVTFGGGVELEVVLQAAAEGLVIVAIIAVFAAFNSVVSHYELVQRAPRAFHELGLVVVVGLAFVPSVVDAIRAVRETDRARTGGAVVRRGRLGRLVVPVVETGLERALSLAESMDARGFARDGTQERASAWWGLAGLLALVGAFLALVGQERPAALVLGVLALSLLAVAVGVASRHSSRTRYRHTPITRVDVAMMLAFVASPVALAVLSSLGEPTLHWSVVPLAWPGFSPLVALSLLPLLLPVLMPAPVPVGVAEHAEPGMGAVR